MISEISISRAIIKSFLEDLMKNLEIDVAVVGAGPSGLTAARYLAKEGAKVVVFERNLYVGGGIWGGGMMFPKIVVQEKAKDILEEIGVNLVESEKGYYVADSVEVVSKCTSATLDAGAKIWIGINVEDVMFREEGDDYRICGVVINWNAVELAGLHVDPLTIEAKVVIDATGHDATVIRRVLEKIPEVRGIVSKKIGEMPMWAEKGEEAVVENTKEVIPGLIVAGMAANAVFRSPRMGPIFGGMLLSGKRAAEIALRILKSS